MYTCIKKHHQALASCRFNRVRYTIQAVHTSSQAGSLPPSVDALRQVEAKLLTKKVELRQFESEFRQVGLLQPEDVAYPMRAHIWQTACPCACIVRAWLLVLLVLLCQPQKSLLSFHRLQDCCSAQQCMVYVFNHNTCLTACLLAGPVN